MPQCICQTQVNKDQFFAWNITQHAYIFNAQAVTDISWGKIQIFCRPAYIYMYRVYKTQSLTFLRVKWLSCSKPLGFIDSNAIMFNSFIGEIKLD